MRKLFYLAAHVAELIAFTLLWLISLLILLILIGSSVKVQANQIERMVLDKLEVQKCANSILSNSPQLVILDREVVTANQAEDPRIQGWKLSVVVRVGYMHVGSQHMKYTLYNVRCD